MTDCPRGPKYANDGSVVKTLYRDRCPKLSSDSMTAKIFVLNMTNTIDTNLSRNAAPLAALNLDRADRT